MAPSDTTSVDDHVEIATGGDPLSTGERVKDWL